MNRADQEIKTFIYSKSSKQETTQTKPHFAMTSSPTHNILMWQSLGSHLRLQWAYLYDVIAVDLKQTVQVDKDLRIRAYYAGHVLGAAMFYAKVGDAAMVYTGDYNMTPDRHLGAAQYDRLNLDLILFSTRASKYAREREFLRDVHTCVAGGGKVLIPSFRLGRPQELCILLDDYWERMNLKVPIYFSAVHKFERSMIDAAGPCVLFATPGMISGGFSLEVFKHRTPSEKNLVTMPGGLSRGGLTRSTQ